MRHLVTSALPYINGVKHLGNLVGSMLPADVYARFLRATGREVLYICATDEHGTPAEISALEAGLEVSEYCKRMHDVQVELGRRFNLSFDYFGRSSAPQNHELTRSIAAALNDNGYIEARPMRQIYSLDDQRFLPDRYVIGTCPHCGYVAARGDQCESCTRVLDTTDLIEPRSAISGSKRLELRESLHLFLLLPKLADELRAWIDRQTDWPTLTTSIARKWLDEGLQDRCITRDLKWGVQVGRPGFEGKVYYVWFDAPIAYIGATKEWSDLAPDKRDWKSWWWNASDVRHTEFMAKDNVPFHTIVFPATLMGTRQPWKLADQVKAFSWLTYQGGKFSTSARRGVFMSDALDILPADYWRYWLMANAPEGTDSDFDWKLFGGTINKDLVGVWGNLVNRILTFSNAKFGTRIPEGDRPTDLEQKLADEVTQRLADYAGHLEQLSFRKAMQELRGLWVCGNTYLHQAAPWEAIRTDRERAGYVTRVGINLVRMLAIVTTPIMPESSERILTALNCTDAERLWPKAPILDELSKIPPGREFVLPGLLFRRIADEEVAAWTEKFAGSGKGPTAPTKGG